MKRRFIYTRSNQDPYPSVDNWTIDNWTYIESKTLADETVPQGICLGNNGTTLLVTGHSTRKLWQYTLSTPYVLSSIGSGTATLDWSGPGPVDITYPNDISIDKTGTHFYVLDAGTDRVYHYTCSTEWDLSTAGTYDDYFYASLSSPDGMFIGEDGNYLYTATDGDELIRSYPLSTAWDGSSAGSPTSVNIGSIDGSVSGIAVTPDGTKLFWTGRGSDAMQQYSLPNVHTMTSASRDAPPSPKSFSTRQSSAYGIAFSRNGEHCYIIGSGNSDALVHYDLT